MIDRRTLAKNAAWSVPVIALGVSAPAASASAPVETVGLLIWDNSEPYTVDSNHTLTFNYGFRSDYTSAGIAICTVTMLIDNSVVHKDNYSLISGRSADGHTFQTNPLLPGKHTWSILVTAPGFNTLSNFGTFTTP